MISFDLRKEEGGVVLTWSTPLVKVEIKEGALEQSVELIASMLSVGGVVKVKLDGEGTDNGFFNIVDVSGLILE